MGSSTLEALSASKSFNTNACGRHMFIPGREWTATKTGVEDFKGEAETCGMWERPSSVNAQAVNVLALWRISDGFASSLMNQRNFIPPVICN